MEPQWGRLAEPGAAPPSGERAETLLAHAAVRVEQILSGRNDEPVDCLGEGDEWVVLLSGSATVEAGGETRALTPGAWVFLPAGLPHRVVRTAPGTSWLAVHAPPGP